jgi:hypothetical protein
MKIAMDSSLIPIYEMMLNPSIRKSETKSTNLRREPIVKMLLVLLMLLKKLKN